MGNALVFCCMTGMVALAAESYLRFIAVETDPFGLSLPARRWFVLHTKLNSLGFRDNEWSPDKPPGVRRIAFIGHSRRGKTARGRLVAAITAKKKTKKKAQPPW